jgi:hypothetical protein
VKLLVTRSSLPDKHEPASRCSSAVAHQRLQKRRRSCLGHLLAPDLTHRCRQARPWLSIRACLFVSSHSLFRTFTVPTRILCSTGCARRGASIMSLAERSRYGLSCPHRARFTSTRSAARNEEFRAAFLLLRIGADRHARKRFMKFRSLAQLAADLHPFPGLATTEPRLPATADYVCRCTFDCTASARLRARNNERIGSL